MTTDSFLDANAVGPLGSITAPEFTPTSYQPPETLQAQAASSYMTPETKVAHQLETLFSKDSPLNKIAETRAKEQANQMGLLSTSMAVGAGQRELAREFTPIAMADAQSASQFGLSQQQADAAAAIEQQRGLVSGALAGQQAAHQADLAGVQGGINAQLQGQQGLIDSNLLEQKGLIETEQMKLDSLIKQGLIKTQGDVDAYLRTLSADLESGLLEQRQGYELELQREAQDFDKIMADLNIAASARERLGNATATIYDNAVSEITNIMRDPNITGDAQARAIERVQGLMRDSLNSLATMYDVELDWSSITDPGSTFDESADAPSSVGPGDYQPGAGSPVTNLYILNDAVARGQLPPLPRPDIITRDQAGVNYVRSPLSGKYERLTRATDFVGMYPELQDYSRINNIDRDLMNEFYFRRIPPASEPQNY